MSACVHTLVYMFQDFSQLSSDPKSLLGHLRSAEKKGTSACVVCVCMIQASIHKYRSYSTHILH